MRRLSNPIRPYAWGSTTALPQLLGRVPTGEPQAELWMGAHPSSPSVLQESAGGERSLLDAVNADPTGELGAGTADAFGGRLPFLLKLLAAAAPLSLQAHPDPAQARQGFARENAAGVSLAAAHRNYNDDQAKPELLCALTPFQALAGFRPAAETLAVVDGLGAVELSEAFAPLRQSPHADGIRATFTALMTADADRRTAWVAAAVKAAESRPDVPGAGLILRLAEHYPGDVGVVAALLLNHIELVPGEAIYLPAGNLHAYLVGLGVEILANSDNVLRGGLTTKHIDVPELLSILDFAPQEMPVVRPTTDGGEQVYATPAREFRLSRIAPETVGGSVALDERGAQILCCVQGSVRLRDAAGDELELGPGRSAYAAARDGVVTVSGDGVCFRATVGGDRSAVG